MNKLKKMIILNLCIKKNMMKKYKMYKINKKNLKINGVMQRIF